MAIRCISHVSITKIVSVRDFFLYLMLNIIHASMYLFVRMFGLEIGKASPAFRDGAAISYGGRVIEFNKFEILIGDPRAVQWVRYSFRLDIQRLGAKPLDGGRRTNGSSIYIARVRYDNGVHTAKLGENNPGAHLGFNGTEVVVDDYEVLCLN